MPVTMATTGRPSRVPVRAGPPPSCAGRRPEPLGERPQLHGHGAHEGDGGVGVPVNHRSGPGGGTSSAGLRSKNPAGTSWKPVVSTGMTGQSSGRGTWVTPNVCHTTTSVPTSDRSAAVQRRQTVAARVLVGEVARGPPLVGVVRGDPQVPGGEPGPAGDARLRPGRRSTGVARGTSW